MNQSQMSLGFYDSALATNASDTSLLKKKAEALIKCGRIREAGLIYQDVLCRNGKDTQALVRTGDSLCSQGNFNGGISYYKQALAIEPNNAGFWMREGDAYMIESAKDMQKLEAAAKNLGKQPGSMGYQPVSSQQLESMSSYQEAVKCYEKAMQIDPKLSVIVSMKIMSASQAQVSSYQNLLNDVQSSV